METALDAHPWLRECPWRDDLKRAVHIGWPGGAPNSHRVDWTPLQNLSPHVHVTLVCDNDSAGENAARFISHALQRRMDVLRFGEEFPRGFDLADKFPEAMFGERKGHRQYIGPTLHECLEPATWATRADKRLRAEFVEEWWYTVRPAKFINQHHVWRC